MVMDKTITKLKLAIRYWLNGSHWSDAWWRASVLVDGWRVEGR